ncbi:MAG: S49 family peptidase, partial [Lysobacterales bacterium]|jgi:protease-4
VAGGQVWSGSQAKERGLIDQTGTLQQAVDAAARIAGLGSDYRVAYAERELSPAETFLLQMVGSTSARLGLDVSAAPALHNTLLESILDDLGRLARAGGGFSVAARCLCDGD